MRFIWLLLRTSDLATQDAHCDRCDQRRGSSDNSVLMVMDTLLLLCLRCAIAHRRSGSIAETGTSVEYPHSA